MPALKLARALPLVCVIPLLSSFLALNAAQSFTAGAARLDITPGAQLSNWVTHKPYAEVLDHVFVRALVLGTGGNRVAIVSWDLLYPMEGAVDQVRKGIAQKTGIPADNVLVCATHNHSAPWSPICGHPLTKAEGKVLQSVLSDPAYPAWADTVFSQTIKAVEQADKARAPAHLAIGRAYVGDVLFNRRPIKPDGTVQTLSGVTDAFVMPNGLRFGQVDSTLTLLMLHGKEDRTIATLYHMACHAVVVYPKYNGISGDWPGMVSSLLEKQFGGESLFLQGCAGDINPIKRGVEARDEIATIVASRAVRASKSLHALPNLTNQLRVARMVIQAPVKEELKAELKRDFLPVEVQTITCGDLAIVALPGEPLTALSAAILAQSPFPHTIVLGYANGLGVQYVGMPGERARGGYEMGIRSLGSDDCGKLLVDAAVGLLQK